jgi:hypothetical protein
MKPNCPENFNENLFLKPVLLASEKYKMYI